MSLTITRQLPVAVRSPLREVSDIIPELLMGAFHLREELLRLHPPVTLPTALARQLAQLLLDGLEIIIFLIRLFVNLLIVDDVGGWFGAEEATVRRLVLRTSTTAEEAEETVVVRDEHVRGLLHHLRPFSIWPKQLALKET